MIGSLFFSDFLAMGVIPCFLPRPYFISAGGAMHPLMHVDFLAMGGSIGFYPRIVFLPVSKMIGSASLAMSFFRSLGNHSVPSHFQNNPICVSSTGRKFG